MHAADGSRNAVSDAGVGTPRTLADPDTTPGADPDEQIGRLLETLAAAASEDGGTRADLSLARLSKRSGLPMSTLRRFLIALEDAGLVRFTLGEDGRGTAGLTAQGRALIDH